MTHMQAETLLEFRCEALPVVRIGLIGLGERGMKTLERYALIEGAEIRCIADLRADRLQEACARLTATGRRTDCLPEGAEAWHDICRRSDIDLIYICTDWNSHCEIAVEAMRCGKHVAIEVPAATTVAECWLLVRTAEQMRRHCFMTENCCYDLFSLATLEMARAGRLGEITHCEGAYIHDLREKWGEGATCSGKKSHGWMEEICVRHGGNPYPTHGLGPLGWLLNLHRGDRMEYLVALTSGECGGDNRTARVSNTLIRTVRGKTILLQFDVTTPRPYSRLQTICGTEGFAQKYPVETLQLSGTGKTLTGSDAIDEIRRHATSPVAALWEKGQTLNVPNAMNYAMDARLIHCLQNGLPLDIDVYDAAEWSCIAELSEQSARNGSIPVEIPDFTSGHWNDVAEHKFF